MTEQRNSIHFPVDTLLKKLKAKGFYFGVDQYLRVERIMEVFGEEYGDDPEKLKQILAPILVQSEEESLAFDQIFNEQVREVLKTAQEQISQADPSLSNHILPPRINRNTSLFRWVIPLIGAIVCGVLALSLLYIQQEDHTNEELRPEFEVYHQEEDRQIGLEDTVYVGHTLRFENRSEEFMLRRWRERHKDSVRRPLIRRNVRFTWKMGDGTDSITTRLRDPEPVTHRFLQEGLFIVSLTLQDTSNAGMLAPKIKEHRIRVICEEKPTIKKISNNFHANDQVPSINEPVYFEIEVEGNADEYAHTWWIEGGDTLDDNAYAFEKEGLYQMRVLSEPYFGSIGVCDQISATFQLNVVDRDKKHSLEPLAVSSDPAGIYQVEFSLWAKLIPGLLLVGLIFLIDRIRLRKRREQLLQQAKNLNDDQSKGPYEIPFPKLESLLHYDQGVYELAKVLRQRRKGDIQKLDIPTTIQKTSQSLGLLQLAYNNTSKASEYLVLIEQIQPQSHTARLFERLVQMLKGEDVLLELFYFQQDIRRCWNAKFPKGISLEELRQKYGQHRLLVYSDGLHMIDPYGPYLQEWVPEIMEPWQDRAALISPVPVADWGYREKMLAEHFYVLAAELESQGRIADLFTRFEKPDFETLVKQTQDLLVEGEESLIDYNFEKLEDLKIYLGDARLELLAATVVYPVPTWEMTLAMAEALTERNKKLHSAHNSLTEEDQKYLLQYPTLLRLSRIPWMQHGTLSPRLRAELVNTLDADTEALARETVLKVLNRVKKHLDKNSFAGKQLSIQRMSNSFLLNPHRDRDGKIAEQMYLLWQSNQLNDPLIESRLYKPSEKLRGERLDEYLRTSQEHITPMRTLFKAMLISLLVVLATFFWGNTIDRSLKLKAISQEYSLGTYMLTHPVEELDSAAYFNDEGVRFAQEGEILEAQKYFYQALLHKYKVLRQEEKKEIYPDSLVWEINLLKENEVISSQLIHAYPIAGKNLLSLLYNREGVEDFNKQRYSSAKKFFENKAIPLTQELAMVHGEEFDSLHLNMLHGAGLSIYFGGRNDYRSGAEYYQDEILGLYPGFFQRIPAPHLQSYLEKYQADTEFVCKGVGIQAPEFFGAIAEELESQKIMYSSADLGDNSGIFHRMAKRIAEYCPTYQFPPLNQYRYSRDIARWYHEQNSLILVEDPMRVKDQIVPGSVMFYGVPGQEYKDLTPEQLWQGVKGGSAAVVHVGMVTEVITDSLGQVIEYVLMHGISTGKSAKRTAYHSVNPPREGYPILGNWNQPWLAMASMVVKESAEDVQGESAGDEGIAIEEPTNTLPITANCSELATPESMSSSLAHFSEKIEKDSIWYSAKNPNEMRDEIGIFFRMVNHVKSICGNYLYPDPNTTRSTRAIARWYDDQGNLSLVYDPMSSRALIQPGSVMFFGKSGKEYSNPGEISHMGVVTAVKYDADGKVVSYTMMHGHRPGKIAHRTHYHSIEPPRLNYPVLGNGNQQWVAIANIMTPISGQTIAPQSSESKSLAFEPDPQTPKEEVSATQPLPNPQNCASNDQLSKILTQKAQELEAQKIMYSQRPPEALADHSGVFFRMSNYVKELCPENEYPDPNKNRYSKSILQWFYDHNNLQIVYDTEEVLPLLKPGTVLFFGRWGMTYKPAALTIDVLTGSQGMQHMGVITEMIKDDKGEIIGYKMMHGRSTGKIAKRTLHYKNPPHGGFSGLGHWQQQLVAISFIMTPSNQGSR